MWAMKNPSEEEDRRLVEAIETLADLAPDEPEALRSYVEACCRAILVSTIGET
jgi:hypothetical protein